MRRSVIAVLAVVAACSSAPDRTAPATPPPPPTATPAPTPLAAGLASELEAIEAGGEDPAASGRRQQEIVAALGEPSVRADTLPLLREPTAARVALLLRARDELTQLTRPGTAFPDWRIVEPLPADRLRAFYQEAERATSVPWRYLAAINFVETKMGRIVGLSTAGARGPMQFIAPTWARFGRGDIDDPHDAIQAAARLLRANGAPGNMANALYRYNPSQRYVRAIDAYAAYIAGAPHAYELLHAWEVYYRRADGTYLLPVGYPSEPARRL